MKRLALVVMGLVLLTGIFTPLVGAASDYSISMEDGVTVPEQSIKYDGSRYTFSSIGRSTAESVTVTTSAPTGDDYVVYLVDEGSAIDSGGAVGPDTTTFDISTLTPGTYAVATVPSSSPTAVMPLVVAGYETRISNVDTQTNLEFNISTSKIDSGAQDISQVTLLVWDDSETIEVAATKQSAGEYTVTMPQSQVDAGDYTAVAVVEGPDDVYDNDELLGVSDPVSLTIEDPTPTKTQSPTDTEQATTTTDTSPPSTGSRQTSGAQNPAQRTETSTPTSTSPGPNEPYIARNTTNNGLILTVNTSEPTTVPVALNGSDLTASDDVHLDRITINATQAGAFSYQIQPVLRSNSTISEHLADTPTLAYFTINQSGDDPAESIAIEFSISTAAIESGTDNQQDAWLYQQSQHSISQVPITEQTRSATRITYRATISQPGTLAVRTEPVEQVRVLDASLLADAREGPRTIRINATVRALNTTEEPPTLPLVIDNQTVTETEVRPAKGRPTTVSIEAQVDSYGSHRVRLGQTHFGNITITETPAETRMTRSTEISATPEQSVTTANPQSQVSASGPGFTPVSVGIALLLSIVLWQRTER